MMKNLMKISLENAVGTYIYLKRNALNEIISPNCNQVKYANACSN